MPTRTTSLPARLLDGRGLSARPLAVRLAWSAAVWLAALGLSAAASPHIQRSAFVFFWVAVLFAAWLGGLAAAVVAAVGAVVAVDYFVVHPRHAFDAPSTSELLTLAIFIGAATLVSALAASLARAQRTSRALTEELQSQAVELELQMDEAQGLAAEIERANDQLRGALADAEAAQGRAELGVDRARRLLAVAAGLNEATTPETVADVLFREALAAVGADAGAFALVRSDADGGRTFETVRTRGFSAPLTERYRRYPLTPGRPLSDAVLAREPRLIASREAWAREYPAVVRDTGDTGYEAFAAVPVVSGGQVLAALAFSFREPARFDDGMRTFLATLGEQCGLALERARASEAERRASERSAAILSSIRDGFVAVDRGFRYTYVNPSAEALLRRPAAELLGQVMWDAFPPLHESEFGRALRQAMTSRAPVTVEARWAPLGTWLEARIYPALDGISVFFQDVTARRQAHDARAFLADATALLNASLDHATTLRAVARAAVPALGDWCAVDVVRDPERGAWPPAVERLAVVHDDPARIALAEELARRHPTDWSARHGLAAALRDGTPTFLPEVTEATLAAGARDAEHLALLRAIGFSAVIVVPLVARGRTLGALTLCTSESGRRYAEADLALATELAHRAATAVDNARLYEAAATAWHAAEEARTRAEEANAAKARFLATMSHELRTPLNAIAGHVQLLELGIHGAVTPAQRDALARVARAQHHLLGLINDLLNYARLESGRVEYDVSAVRLADVVADVLPMVQPQIAARGLALDVRLAPDDAGAPVLADREKLAQVLLNLLSNAVKFTPAGGRITIDRPARADGSGPRDVAWLRVADTGIGIARDKLETVFEPFVQLGKSYARGAEGTGLGLSISRDLARGMGGDLRARSAEGVGSSFTLTLRRAGAGEGGAGRPT